MYIYLLFLFLHLWGNEAAHKVAERSRGGLPTTAAAVGPGAAHGRAWARGGGKERGINK